MVSLMLAMGTPSFCALMRSMSTKTCGVFALKGENTEVRPGALRAAATSSSVAAASSSGRAPCRSWMRMAKPPPVPMPGTAGGGITMMKAPWIAVRRLRSSLVIAAADNPFFRRASGSSNTGNSAAALPDCVRVAPEKPANTATRTMPGVSSAILSISRTTSVVRASEAAPGNCAEMMT